MPRLHLIFLPLVLALSFARTASAKNLYCAEDPYADPKNDICNPLRYIPSNVLTTIALACFGNVTVAHFLSMRKWGAKYMLALPLGGVGYCIGLCCRYAFHANPQSLGIYMGVDLFIVLSPCAFIAAVYVLLGRLARYLEAGHHLLIRPERLTLVFVSSDVITFLIQASGGGMSAITDDTIRNVGEKMFLAGLILQLISFGFFTTMLTIWVLAVRSREPMTWNLDDRRGKPWYLDWRALLGALYISCAGILVRSFYRVIELSQGYTGKFATTEGYFYALDALPLLVAIGALAVFWPGRFINSEVAGTSLHSNVAKSETIELSGHPSSEQI